MTAIQTDAYQEFLAKKAFAATSSGFFVEHLPDYLFEFQKRIVQIALQRGKCAVFADTGLGKSRMELAWSDAVTKRMDAPILMLAPLSVGRQTVAEGAKIGIPVTLCKTQADIRAGINITNYERLDSFDDAGLAGLVPDESSIMKSFTGATTNALIEFARSIPYLLPCTATPSPNDYTELGNHAEFLGVMTRTEMLATFFTHDGGDTSVWRLKGHAKERFWQWVASWAIACGKPSDIGFPEEDARYILPPLIINEYPVTHEQTTSGLTLFAAEAVSLSEQRVVRRDSLTERCAKSAELVNAKPDQQFIVWCNLNDEQDEMARLLGDDAVSIQGSTKDDDKERLHDLWLSGQKRVLITKKKIFGFGANWQHCHEAVFVGIDDSHEQLYQAIRRNWRFGQTLPVTASLVFSEAESRTLRNLKRKQKEAETMQSEMVAAMKAGASMSVESTTRQTDEYVRDVQSGNGWTSYLGDSCEVLQEIESDSIGYSIFSPPFASLYTYSNSGRDLGNCKTHSDFYEHFKFIVGELFRVTMPGRLLSFHCMNLPMGKERDGYIGIADFRGDLIRLFQEAGFIYHSEVVIWKDPVTAMQRTKAIGLLHKQLVKDSAMSRQGIPDYLVTMRKPGINPVPVAGPLEEYHGDESGFLNEPYVSAIDGATSEKSRTHRSIEIWQRYASPVWMDINPSDTLQFRAARDGNDERHICPLQLQVIRRGLQLWSMPGDKVLSPFAGIASEGYCAVEMDREFVGIELKRSYWEQGLNNLRVVSTNRQLSMGDVFDAPDTEPVHVPTPTERKAAKKTVKREKGDEPSDTALHFSFGDDGEMAQVITDLPDRAFLTAPITSVPTPPNCTPATGYDIEQNTLWIRFMEAMVSHGLGDHCKDLKASQRAANLILRGVASDHPNVTGERFKHATEHLEVSPEDIKLLFESEDK